MSLAHTFKFRLGDLVFTPHLSTAVDSDHISGLVVSRSENSDGRCDQYMVRYTDHFGREVEEWIAEDRLTS